MSSSVPILCSTVAEALGLPPESITPTSTAADVPEWTSLAHLQVLLAVEGQFAVRFRTDELPMLNGIPALSNRLGIQ